ncbi:hypothetical protein [Micromonospora sp. NBC_01813]|uniref:hypothetical protein n=1 Tax=Micromonospora sp. NBC_01813 TaxID=2975988 RepID=UPI002DD7CE27|nr:hypothetical protein [Micromonospora sp. NBC_01813]WSA08655.1 hypothetical protein OG958_31525 [Micromonospora sp. NBC_01813]
MSVDEVKGQLREGTDDLRSAAATIHSVRETVRSCHVAAIAVLTDSQHPHVTGAHHRLREADREGELVLDRIKDSTGSAEEYAKALG